MKSIDEFIKNNFEGLAVYTVNTDYYQGSDYTTYKTYVVLEKGSKKDGYYKYAPGLLRIKFIADTLDKPLIAKEDGYGTDFVDNISIAGDRFYRLKELQSSNPIIDFDTSYFYGLILSSYDSTNGVLKLLDKPTITDDESHIAGDPHPKLDKLKSHLDFIKSLVSEKEEARKEQDLIEIITDDIKHLSKEQRAKVLSMLIN